MAALPVFSQTISQVNPATLPAHDSHQSFLVAVAPMISAERYKEKFGKHTPYDVGIVALDVYFRNDNDSPVRLDLQTVRLAIGAPGDARQKLEPLTPEEVADDVLLTPKDPTQRRRLPPIGTGLKPNRDKTWEDFAGVLRSVAMTADIIGPHTTVHGFYYFNISRHYDWLSNARLDVPDLSFMVTKQALFFFQIELAPAVK